MAGLDQAALAALHAAAGAAATGAAAMAAARAAFASHYAEVREFAGHGGAPAYSPPGGSRAARTPRRPNPPPRPGPGTGPATPAEQAVTIRDTTAHRAGAGKADPVSAADRLLGTGPAARRATG